MIGGMCTEQIAIDILEACTMEPHRGDNPAFSLQRTTRIGCSPLQACTYGMECHLPIDVGAQAYWALSMANFDSNRGPAGQGPFNIVQVFDMCTVDYPELRAKFKVIGSSYEALLWRAMSLLWISGTSNLPKVSGFLKPLCSWYLVLRSQDVQSFSFI
ncbi:hypothetical protein Tco_0992850 [Tanacetum coccineum]|uniref:Uncharacterized protein n=1 Tax=Tanacetum coccineum TaxID=301880 RepID=A0ABQ5F3A1_9ASTR